MFFEVPHIGKGLVALLTRVRPLSRVHLHVCFHIVGLTELSPADLTAERSFSCMDTHVPLEIPTDAECHSTDLAGIRSLPCVDPEDQNQNRIYSL